MIQGKLYVYIAFLLLFGACNELWWKPANSIEKVTPADKAALVKAIQRATDAKGNEVNLNHIDTSAITDMSYLFSSNSKKGYGLHAFNGKISGWDVSQVTNMSFMFNGAKAFNSNISKWNVAKVTNMEGMFEIATAFNQDISKWKVGKVTNMSSMFSSATAFDQDISEWDVSQVTIMVGMFIYASAFKQNLDAWGNKIHDKIKSGDWSLAYSMFSYSGLASNLPSWCKNVPACKAGQ